MERYGLVGEKLGHSFSPQIHRMIFELLGMKGVYSLFEIPREHIASLGEKLKKLGVKGVNVTIPYKQTVMEQLDYLSPEAEKIGAVNTVLLKDDKLYGYNTDYFGLDVLFKTNSIEPQNSTAAVLGTGGASKAAVAYLLDKGVAKLFLVTRSKQRSNNPGAVELINYDELEGITGNILVNATPVGMYPNIDICPIVPEVASHFETLVDLIYNPLQTEFMKLGEKFGKKICGGLTMLIGQAVKAQEIWQNRQISTEVIQMIYLKLKEEIQKA